MRSNARGAALMCGNKLFQRYLSARRGEPVTDPDQAAQALRAALNIESRRELDTCGLAESRYRGLMNNFNQWRRRTQGYHRVSG